MKIERRYDLDAADQPRAHAVGSYVRKVGEDMGTGIVVAIADATVLDEKTNKVHYQRVYHIHWLHMNGGMYTQEIEADLAASARSVPQFASAEEAEAWMEQQLKGGNWTDAAQDAVDSDADMDVELRKLLDGETGTDG